MEQLTYFRDYLRIKVIEIFDRPSTKDSYAVPNRLSGKPFEIQRLDAIQDNISTCKSIVIFFAFVLTFVLAMLVEQSESSARLANHIRAKIENGPVRLDTVNTVGVLSDYLERSFLPQILDDSADTKMAHAASNYLVPVDVANRLLGGIQVRQVRSAQTSNCSVGPMFAQYSINCFPAFSGNSEDKERFGETLQFRWQDDSSGSAYTGKITRYSPGGFSQILPTNRTNALRQLVSLRNDNFLGQPTRAVFIDFTVWSTNLGAYAVSRLLFEFGPSGAAEVTIRVLVLTERSLKIGGLGQTSDILSVVLIFVNMSFVVWYMFEEIYYEMREKKWTYLLDFWNYLDWSNLLLLLAAFALRLFVFIEAAGTDIGTAELTNLDSYTNMQRMAEMVETIRTLNAFNAVILTIKMTKYTQHLPYLKDLINTIWDAFNMFLPFLVMFGIAFLGFVIAFNIGFGDKIAEFSTFGGALVYLARTFLRDVDLMPAYHITPIFGASMILVYYVAIVLVGVNVLFAIMAETMYRAREEAKHKKRDKLHADEPVEEFGRIVMNWIRGFVRKRLGRSRRQERRAGTPGPRVLALADANKARPALMGQPSMLSLGVTDVDETEYGEREFTKNPGLTSEKLLTSIEHMSGRVLGTVQEVNIEIRSELHGICERVAQMQMAVEELTSRTESVRTDQADALKRYEAAQRDSQDAALGGTLG